MKKHITPYLIALTFILALSILTLIFVNKENVMNDRQSAAIFNTSTSVSTQGIIKTVTPPEPQSVFQLMHGTCVVIARDRNGNAIAELSYAGHFNASYDCVRNIKTADTTPNIQLSSTSTGATITVNSLEAYLSSEVMISLLQSRLAALGFLGQADLTGTFSPKTFEAIKSLQAKNRISATGYLDTATLTILNSVGFAKDTTTGTSYKIITK